jgi:GH15 family glucan-1,4-alpha-glucosidase
MTPARFDPPAIGDHAVLSDGRSSALVTRDGTVDWWPLPTIDAPPVFASLVDPDRGGSFRLEVAGRRETSRRYLPGTNVLETRVITDTGEVTVTDALNVGMAGRLPWSELVRRIDGVSGRVELRWEVDPGDRFGQARPEVLVRADRPTIRLDDQHLAVIASGPTATGEDSVYGSVRLGAGDRCTVALVGTDDEPLALPTVEEVEGRLERTVDHWRRWCGQLDHDGPWAAEVERSALALKTLIYESTGAIAAAVTTSLPERIGGPKNWDYRYAWVRDSSFILDALINLDLREEVHRAVSWLLSALRRHAPELHVFYTLEGGVPDEETQLDVAGFRNSRPVRSGNGASNQMQLGCFGDLFDTICRYAEGGHLLDPASAELLAGYADRCVELWGEEDSGIWELPDRHHYTISKIGCWVALDRAARLADDGQLPDAHADRWRKEADAVRRWVQDRCWSEAKQSYTFYADSDDLDAAVLLAGRTGFDRGPRLSSTCDAIRRELGAAGSPLVWRYSGMPEEEGAFVACTFWEVESLALVGRTEEAHRLMDEAVRLVNDVGLLSEEQDPATGAFLGNLPQGLSHLALINAALLLGARPGAER